MSCPALPCAGLLSPAVPCNENQIRCHEFDQGSRDFYWRQTAMVLLSPLSAHTTYHRAATGQHDRGGENSKQQVVLGLGLGFA